MEGIVDNFETCREICDLIQRWKFNEAKEIITRSNSLHVQVPAPPSCPSISILQTPFYHYQYGSLHNLANVSSLILDDEDQSLVEMVWKLKYWGLNQLAEYIIHEKKSKTNKCPGLTDESILAELKQNGNPKDFCKCFENVKITPLSKLSQNDNGEISKLKTNYETLKSFIKQLDWNNASLFLTDNPTTLLAPYFWNETDEKCSPFDLVFGYNAPVKFIHLLIDIGGWRVINGAYNIMHKSYPLHRACFSKQPVEIIRHLVDVAGTNVLHTIDDSAGDTGGRTPLQTALDFNAPIEVIQYLAKAGGKEAMQKSNEYGETLLMIACRRNRPLEVIQSMVDIIGEEDEGGIHAVTTQNLETALHYACRYASIESVQFLVERGGEKAIHAITRNMETPIFGALVESRLDVAQFLIDSSSVSLFKIGQNTYDSFLSMYLTSNNYVSVEALRFILEQCDSERIIHTIFGIFTKPTKNPTNSSSTLDEDETHHRAYNDLLQKLGYTQTWMTILPFLQQSNSNKTPILHSIMNALASDPVTITFNSPQSSIYDSLSAPNIAIPPFPNSAIPSEGDDGADSTNHTSLGEGKFKEIISKFPNCVNERDEEGRLPVHIAAECGLPFPDLMPIVWANMSALEERDPKTGLYTFALAASQSSSDLATIYTLLEENPNVII